MLVNLISFIIIALMAYTSTHFSNENKNRVFLFYLVGFGIVMLLVDFLTKDSKEMSKVI